MVGFADVPHRNDEIDSVLFGSDSQHLFGGHRDFQSPRALVLMVFHHEIDVVIAGNESDPFKGLKRRASIAIYVGDLEKIGEKQFGGVSLLRKRVFE